MVGSLVIVWDGGGQDVIPRLVERPVPVRKRLLALWLWLTRRGPYSIRCWRCGTFRWPECRWRCNRCTRDNWEANNAPVDMNMVLAWEEYCNTPNCRRPW